MKAIIKDYLTILKEDGELDALLVNLLFHMNIEPKSRPQKGRQHGVDIMAVGKDPEDDIKKVFLISVKRGNLDRNNWNSGKNSIKPSLEEIFEVYIPTQIAKEYTSLPVKIVFAMNGVIEQTAMPLWNGYKNKNSKRKIKLVDWDIDKIALMSEEYLFNETLLPGSSLLLLRKSLAFIDVNDYNLLHVTQLFNNILFHNKSSKEKPLGKYKRLSLINICVNLIFKWAREQNNLKNALFTAERGVLLSWKFVAEQKGENDKKFIKQFVEITTTLLNVQHAYGEKTIQYCFVKDSLNYVGRLNHSEYTLLCYEYLGIISTVGLNYYYLAETLDVAYKNEALNENMSLLNQRVVELSESLLQFVFNNPGCNYPVYDSHSIELNLAFLFLYKTGRSEEIKSWIDRILKTIEITYSRTKFFPLFYESHDKLIDAKVNGITEKQPSSILLTIIAEWCVVLNSPTLYKNLLEMNKRHFPEINLQLWYPDKEIEKHLYTENADQECGKTKYSITLYDDMIEYEKEIIEELNMMNLSPELELGFFKNGFPFLGLLASRHYKTMVFPYYWRSLVKVV